MFVGFTENGAHFALTPTCKMRFVYPKEHLPRYEIGRKPLFLGPIS